MTKFETALNQTSGRADLTKVIFPKFKVLKLSTRIVFMEKVKIFGKIRFKTYGKLAGGKELGETAPNPLCQSKRRITVVAHAIVFKFVRSHQVVKYSSSFRVLIAALETWSGQLYWLVLLVCRQTRS